jgi:hypothetical protein
VTELVVVVPLKPGAADRVRELLAEGPPFELEDTAFHRHAVHVTDREAIFVFEGTAESTTLVLPAEDPALLEAAAAWREVIAEKPRIARLAFSWERPPSAEDLSFEPTPGPGDSDGGELYAP